jgi:acyl carrier protein
MSTPMYDLLVELLTEHLGVPADEVRPEATLEDLEVDSLALVELVVVIEDKLGVALDFDVEVQAQRAELTVAQTSELLEQMLGEQQSTGPEPVAAS